MQTVTDQQLVIWSRQPSDRDGQLLYPLPHLSQLYLRQVHGRTAVAHALPETVHQWHRQAMDPAVLLGGRQINDYFHPVPVIASRVHLSQQGLQLVLIFAHGGEGSEVFRMVDLSRQTAPVMMSGDFIRG